VWPHPPFFKGFVFFGKFFFLFRGFCFSFGGGGFPGGGGGDCIAACFIYGNDGRILIEFGMNVVESVITPVCTYLFSTIGKHNIADIPV